MKLFQLHCHKITDIRKIRNDRNKTYADVVSGELEMSTKEVEFETKNNELNFVKRDNRKESIDLNVILVNLTENQNPTYPPKPCSYSSTSKNSSDSFDMQASLDEDVDDEILQILDDLLRLFEWSASMYQRTREKVNDTFQNI